MKRNDWDRSEVSPEIDYSRLTLPWINQLIERRNLLIALTLSWRLSNKRTFHLEPCFRDYSFSPPSVWHDWLTGIRSPRSLMCTRAFGSKTELLNWLDGLEQFWVLSDDSVFLITSQISSVTTSKESLKGFETKSFGELLENIFNETKSRQTVHKDNEFLFGVKGTKRIFPLLLYLH